jgi:hypothetical protein
MYYKDKSFNLETRDRIVFSLLELVFDARKFSKGLKYYLSILLIVASVVMERIMGGN